MATPGCLHTDDHTVAHDFQAKQRPAHHRLDLGKSSTFFFTVSEEGLDLVAVRCQTLGAGAARVDGRGADNI